MTKCRQRYKFNEENRNYEVDEEVENEETSVDHVVGDTFVCHPGPFTAEKGKIYCARVSHPFDLCKEWPNCPLLNFKFKDNSCNLHCFNVYWAAFSIQAFHFQAMGPTFANGNCGDESSYTPEPSHTSREPYLESSNASNESLKAAVAIGWVLFAIALGVIVAYFVYRFKKSKQKTSRPNPLRSESRGNAHTGQQVDNHHGGRGRVLELQHPYPAAEKGGHEYDECDSNGNSANDYNIIDEEKRNPAATNKLTKLDDIKAMLKRRPLPGYTNEASVIMAGAARTGHEEMSGQGTTTELNTGETNNDYTELEAGSLSEDQQIPEDEPELYGIDSGIREERQDSKNSNMADYAKLNSRGLGLAASVKPADPDTYNTASSRFEERSKNGAYEMPKPMARLYDVPSG